MDFVRFNYYFISWCELEVWKLICRASHADDIDRSLFIIKCSQSCVNHKCPPYTLMTYPDWRGGGAGLQCIHYALTESSYYYSKLLWWLCLWCHFLYDGLMYTSGFWIHSTVWLIYVFYKFQNNSFFSTKTCEFVVFFFLANRHTISSNFSCRLKIFWVYLLSFISCHGIGWRLKWTSTSKS